MSVAVAPELVVPDSDTWTLTDAARAQLEGCGIAYSELFRLVRDPVLSMPGLEPGVRRINGYGLTALVCGQEVRAVEIDGATAGNWQEWAVERADFGDGDVAGADALVKDELSRLTHRSQSAGFPGPRRRRKRRKEDEPPVQKTHILDRVHPALRAEITRQVDGDFSRLVIESPTKVTILPLN